MKNEEVLSDKLTVIPRNQHSVSRKSISDSALKVLYRLSKSGHRACLVGGGVRDLLLGVHPKDFDVATDATPEEVRALFKNSRIIGRRFRLVHIRFGRDIIEVATFRAHAEDSPKTELDSNGRILRDNTFGDIEEDAIRRDFTVNALYYDIADYSLLDYTGGLDDIDQRQLRLIGDAATRYQEDPVRMLRAVRFAAKLDFDIEASAADACWPSFRRRACLTKSSSCFTPAARCVRSRCCVNSTCSSTWCRRWMNGYRTSRLKTCSILSTRRW